MSSLTRCYDCGGLKEGGGSLAELQARCACDDERKIRRRVELAKARREKIRSLLDTGHTQAEVAKKLGITREVVACVEQPGGGL